MIASEEDEVSGLKRQRQTFRDQVEAEEHGRDDVSDGAQTTVLSRPIRDVIAEADYD
jgi:hypothetical protein